MAYVYKGKGFDILPEAEPPTPQNKVPSVPFDTSKCGTTAGYKLHERHEVPKCRPCIDAQAEYSRAYYEKRGGRPSRKKPVEELRKAGRKPIYGTGCGTPAGVEQHRREGTPVCDSCRAARALYRRILRHQSKQVAA